MNISVQKEEAMKTLRPVEILILHFPQLLAIEGIPEVTKVILGAYQPPMISQNRSKWAMVKTMSRKLRAALSLLMIELAKWHAKKHNQVPTLHYMDMVLSKADCPTLSTMIFDYGLFEKSYNYLLVMANLFPLNRDVKEKT